MDEILDADSLRFSFALERCLKVYGDLQIAFTMQTVSTCFENGPYLQAQFLDDLFEIEITSNQFLEPKLTETGQRAIESFGWNAPNLKVDDTHPNYWLDFPNNPEGRMAAANLWTKTLMEVFIPPINTKYELAPLNRKAHDEVAKYLVPLGFPMQFTLFNFKREFHRVPLPERKPNRFIHERTAVSEISAPTNSTENGPLDPTPENFPQFFMPTGDYVRYLMRQAKTENTPDEGSKNQKPIPRRQNPDKPIKAARPKNPQAVRENYKGSPKLWAEQLSKILREALQLELSGEELIYLAKVRGSRQLERQISQLLNGTRWFEGLTLSDVELARLGIEKREEKK